MERQGIEYNSDWELWVNIVALAAFTVGFMIIAYIQLRRAKKLK